MLTLENEPFIALSQHPRAHSPMNHRYGRRQRCLATALFLVASPSLAEPYRFLKGPYLQALTPTSVTVRWEGTEPRPASVVLTDATTNTVRQVRASKPSNFQTVRVDALTPSSTYTYHVATEDGQSEEASFVTAPADNRPFSFLVYGDNRTDHTAHRRVVDAMQTTPSDFLVHTGDMVGDGSNSLDWDTFFRIETPLLRQRCVFSCVGNHELVGKGGAFYVQYFQPSAALPEQRSNEAIYATMRWGNTRFFFLNAMAPWREGDDREWLERELARAATEAGVAHRFVVLHHGPYSSGPHGSNPEVIQFHVVDIFRKYYVDLLLSGHDHLYERGEKNGLHYVVSGGGGAPLYKTRVHLHGALQAAEAVHHFVHVQVDGKRVTLTAKRTDGTVMEACSYDGASPWSCESSIAIDRPDPVTPTSTVAAPGPNQPPRSRSNCTCDLRPSPSGFSRFSGVLWLGLLLVVRRYRRPPRPPCYKVT